MWDKLIVMFCGDLAKAIFTQKDNHAVYNKLPLMIPLID